MFEAVLPVPSDKLLVRAIGFAQRHQQALAFVEDATFDGATLIGDGHRRREIETASGFNQREIHLRRRRIRNDAFDLGNCVVALGADHLAGFIVDDPVTDAGALAPDSAWGIDIARLACRRRSNQIGE